MPSASTPSGLPEFPKPPPIPTTDLLSFIFPSKTPNYDPSRPLFVDGQYPQIRFSYTEVQYQIRRLIAGFKSLPAFKNRRQPVILIHSFNSALYPILMLSTIGAGAIYVGTNPAYTPFELSHALRVSKADVIFCEPDDELLPSMRAALRESNISESILFVLDTRPGQAVPASSGLKSWKTLLNHGSSDWVTFNSLDQCTNTIAAFFFSSGTTGLPKLVTVTHRNLIAQHQLVHAPYAELRQSHQYTQHGGVKYVVAIPLFHIGMAPMTTTSAVLEGRTAFIMRRFELDAFLRIVATHRCTEILIVPPIVHAIVDSGLADPDDAKGRFKYSMRSIRFGLVGAAPLGAEMQGKLQALLGDGAVLGQLWGMTETTCIASYTPPGRVSRSFEHGGSVGWTVPGLEMKLADPETGKDVKDGESGEIWVRGPTITPGYHGNEKATADTFDREGGWLKSGDLGYQDPKTGIWYVVGRSKELIKVRGFQVSPSEIEDVLRSCPGVADVALVGVEISKDNEAPRAYVVKSGDKDGNELTEKAVKNWVAGRLASYKALDGGVQFIEAVPRNASGKILRRLLKEMKPLHELGSSKL